MKFRSLIRRILALATVGGLTVGVIMTAKFVRTTSQSQRVEAAAPRQVGVLQIQDGWYAFDSRGIIGSKVDDQAANATAVHVVVSQEQLQPPVGDMQLFAPEAVKAMESIVSSLPGINFTAQTITFTTADALWFSVATTQNVTLLVDWRRSAKETITNLQAALLSQRYKRGGVTSIDLRFGKKIYLK